MMAVLDCSHPDIVRFITAKRSADVLQNFNISVLVSNEFMRAVQDDSSWQLKFREQSFGSASARELWAELVQSSHSGGEPGVIFVDRVRERNNLRYCEHISATNSCAEQPLPSFGAVPLAAINLAALVRSPFTGTAHIDTSELEQLSGTAVRFLDNVIDASAYPDPRQELESRQKRRIGLGVTGLGDALIACGVRYGSAPALQLLAGWLTKIRDAAYAASVELACERSSFERFEPGHFLVAPFIRELPANLREAIAKYGIRNGVLLSIAPAGSISLLAGNVSSGIEPVFSHCQTRRISNRRNDSFDVRVESYSSRSFRSLFGPRAPLPDSFVTTTDVSAEEHVNVLATAQQFVDASISKTINCSEDATVEDCSRIFVAAHRAGCKSVSLYRPNAIRRPILRAAVADRREQ